MKTNMTPRDALLLLIRADQNHAYSVSQTHWAHLPALAGNPHEFQECWWEVGASPMNQAKPAIVVRDASLESAVRQLLAKLGKDWPETRPQAPDVTKPDPGEGWRFIQYGESISHGDEVRAQFTDGWHKAQLSIGERIRPHMVGFVRRRLR